jgi:hypothetical protein
LIDVLIDSLLRFALGAFRGPVHQTVDIGLEPGPAKRSAAPSPQGTR